MASVDERVVRMTFDNAKFEAGVQKTLETLANLKSALNLDKAGADFEKLEQASNKVNFSHMSDALDQVSNRFSTFGIVGMTVLQNLTTSAMNTAKSILNSLTSPLIEGGKRRALNIEQAKFQIEGLGYAWEDVADDINYGVKSTAYGLDSAAKAASQLLASNVTVGDSMKAALRGISGVAAMTSSEYDDIARVFTTVAGNGRLMGDQLNQLSARGLNVAATLGKALGKTEGEVREMVSKGQIDFATFSKAMDDAFGEHAKKANDTFTGSLSNMKAALSRIGADFATPAYTNLRLAMNALTPAIDAVHKAMKPLVDTASQAMDVAAKLAVDILGKLDLEGKLAGPMEAVNKIAIALGNTIVNLGKAVLRIVAPIVQAFDKAFGATLLDILVRAAEAIANFTSKLVISERMSNNIQRTFTGVFTVISAVADILSRVIGLVSGVLWNALTGTFGFFFDIATSITAVIGDIIVGLKELIDEIMSLRIVKTIVGAVEKAMEAIGVASDVAYKGVQGFADALFDKTFETSALVLGKLVDVIKLVAHALDDAIFKVVEFVAKLRELPAVRGAVQKISDAFGTLRTNVSKVSSSIASRLSPVFEKAKDVIGRLVDKIKELKDQYIELPTMQEAVTRLQEFAIDVFQKSIEIFEKVRDIVIKIVDRVKELSSVSFKAVVKNLSDLRDNIGSTLDMAGKLEVVKNVFYGIRDGIVDMANTSGSMLNKVKEKLTAFVEWLGGKFSKISLGDVIAAGAGGSLIAFMLSFTKFLGSAAKLADAAKGMLDKITALPDAVAGALNNFGKLAKAKAQDIKMERISDIIKNVALLAGAIAILATMDQEKVKSSAAVIGVLGAALIVITGVMTHLAGASTPDAVAKSSAMTLSIAGAVGILVVALKILSKINMDGIAAKLVVMGVLMAELAAFTIAISRLAPKMSGGSVAIIAISVSILMLSRAFQNLSQVPLKSMVSGTLLVGAMISLLALIDKVSTSWKKTASSALGIVAIAIALNTMIGAIQKLGEMDPSVAEQGIAGSITIMIAMGALMIATSAAGQYAVRAGAAMVLVGVALHVIVEAINKIAAIQSSSVTKAQKVIGKMLVLFGVLTVMTKFAGENAAKAGVAIALMSGAMILLAGAMAIMAKVDPSGLKRATKAVTQIMAMFALIIASTSVVRKADKVITTMTICIAALGGVLAVLSLLEPDNVNAASEAITRLMAMFALLLAVTKVTGKAKANIFIMVGVVVALGVVLQKLSELPCDKALAASQALSLVLLAFSASLFIVQDIPVSALEGVVALIGMISIFGLFLGAIGALVTYIPDIQTFLENGIPVLEAVGEGIGSFVGGIINGVLSSASDSLPTIGQNLTDFMSNIQGFVDGASSISSEAESGIQTLTSLLVAMSAADLLDALTWWSDAGSSLEGLNDNLPALGSAVSTFAESVSGLDPETVDAATAVVGLLTQIGMVIETPFFKTTIDYEGAAEALPMLATAIHDFGDNIYGTQTESIENCQKACEIVLGLANRVPMLTGAVALFGGSFNLALFASQLGLLAAGFHAFGDNIYGTQTQSIENCQRACEIVLNLANRVPMLTGLVSLFGGSFNIAMFAAQLGFLADGFHAFGDKIYGTQTESIENCQRACNIVLNLANRIPMLTGLVSLLGGAFNLAMFGAQLGFLADGFHAFGDKIYGTQTESIENCLKACNIVLNLANRVPMLTGIVSLVGGSFNLAMFGAQLGFLADGFHAFGDKIYGTQTESIENCQRACNIILNLANRVPMLTGVVSIATGSFNMIVFSAQLPFLATAFSAYSQQLARLNKEAVTGSVEPINVILDTIKSFMDAGVTNQICYNVGFIPDFAKALTDYSTHVAELNGDAVSKAKDAAQDMLDTINLLSNVDLSPAMAFCDGLKNITDRINNEFLNPLKEMPQQASTAAASIATQVGAGFQLGLSGANSKFLNGGTDLMQSLKQGLLNGQSEVNLGITQILNGMSTTIGMSSGKFTTAGTNVVKAIANGITKARSLATTAMSNVMTSAAQAAASKTASFVSAGRKMVSNIASGVRGSSSVLRSAVQSVVNSAAWGISTSAFYTTGKNAIRGLANGMRDNAYIASNAARTAAKNALDAANKALDEHSPSKEFYKTGRYAMIGMANGISENAKYAERNSAKAATDILDTTNKILGELDMTAELNYDPVIRPVVDMTNVKSAGMAVSSLLSSDIKVGGSQEVNLASRSFDTLARSTYQEQQAMIESNNQVVSAINALREDVANLEMPELQADIYMDSKKVGSSLAPEMNKQLGILAKRGGLS